MKRLIFALSIAFAPFANASPELAEQFGVKARILYQDSVEIANHLRNGDEQELPDAFVDQLAIFAGTALKLGSWSDAQAGVSDFGCIFRGMAEEADVQIGELETAVSTSDKSAALSRLIAMFDDAQSIAAAAAHASRRFEDEKDGNYIAAAPTCAANPADLEVFRP